MANFRLLLALAVRNLFRNPRRTVTIVLTVATGTGSLFVFDGFNAGIMNQYRNNTIHSRYGHGEINTKGYRDKVFEKPWEHWIDAPAPLLAEMRGIPGVTHVFPRIRFFALLTNGQVSLAGRGQGIDGPAEATFFNTLNVVEGKMMTGEPDGVMLGLGLAHSLNVKPGDRVTVLANTIYGSINGVDLTVTGIFHTGAKEFDDTVFRLPIAASQKLLDTDKVEAVALGLDKLEDWPRVAGQITRRHPELEAVPFAVLDKVYYQNAVDWLASQFRIIKIIFMVIVVLGIFNTVSTSVLERKQEVGNLRANGESSWDVLSLFLAEGVVLGLTGAVAGILIAWLVNATLLSKGILMPPSPGLTRQYHVLVELQPLGALETFSLGALCALIGTWLAAFKVTRLPIGEALRAV